VATKVKALAAKAGEHCAIVAATSNQPVYEMSNTSANTQIKVLTDLVKSLLRAIEEQKKEHVTQIETLRRTFTEQDRSTSGRGYKFDGNDSNLII
jgi:hypothetical protein